MTDSEPPQMELIPKPDEKNDPPQKRDFRTVTRSGNELIKTITTTSGAADHGQIIKDGLEAAIFEYISIIVEKADLKDLVSTDDKYKFLGKLDIKSIFEPKIKSKSVVTDKLQHVVDKISADQKTMLKKLAAIDQLEQVIKSRFIFSNLSFLFWGTMRFIYFHLINCLSFWYYPNEINQ